MRNAIWILAALLLLCGSVVADAQDQQPAPAAPAAGQQAAPTDQQQPAPASVPDAKPAPPPSTPSPGKALVFIYRVGKVLGSSSHDHLYFNGVYIAYLKNNEYAGMEVDPGTLVVTGTPEMYFSGGIAMSSYAAVNNSKKKENERIRIEVQADKTYYLKWTSSTMATGIKVTLVDSEVGAKEMSKLHLSKPVEQPAKPPEKPAAQ
jgi:Protein of unknown function (DUF2846)